MSKATATLQWRGTDACADITCDCGQYYHFDGMFMYEIQCSVCGQAYKCLPDIVLVPIETTDDYTKVLIPDNP